MEINKNIFREYDIRGIYPSELNDELAELYSGSGLHGLEEEDRAKSSMMNEKGKRFATDVGTADDFEGRKMRADVQGALKEALDEGKDLESLLLFVKNEY